MKQTTPIGLVAGFVLIFGTIMMGDGWTTFIDIGSIVLVLGGTATALMVGYSLEELKQVPPAVKAFFAFEPPDLLGYVREFSELSAVARREGLLALDRRMGEIDNELMRFGLEMAIDGIEEEEIDELLSGRILEDVKRNQFIAKFFNTAGTYAPAFGMIGTLIGLIQMLQNLSDPSAIGPAMAVAMITTFYGALFANLVFLPFANKMKAQTADIIKGHEMVRLGIMAIVRGDSPSMVEKRMMTYVGEGEASAVEPEPLKQAA